MCNIDYSVIIRTTGKANEKYKSLLQSIDKLVPAPKEVIIVLPYGYCEPEYKIGYETFYYTEKGMVSQRLYGIDMCKTRYALITDDDISFEPDFIEKLYEPIKNNLGSISAGPLYSFLPKRGINTLICMINSSAIPTIRNKEYYCKVSRTTGYFYNRNLRKKYYYANSLPWTCFFADVKILKKIDIKSEVWLDKNGYASLDDTTMFYKAYLMGFNSIVVSDALYKHLDARTSTKGNDSYNIVFSTAFNKLVFWHLRLEDERGNI